MISKCADAEVKELEVILRVLLQSDHRFRRICSLRLRARLVFVLFAMHYAKLG